MATISNDSVSVQQQNGECVERATLADGHPVRPQGAPPSRMIGAVQWTALLLLAVLSYFAFSRLGFQVVEVMGDSMHPTLQQSDHYLLKKWVYLLREPRRFEVVVIVDPQDKGFSVKRIIATAGDTVELKHGDVYLNGTKLTEPYLKKGAATRNPNGATTQTFQLGPDEYFVLGDNRGVSVDSRAYGAVPRRNVLGLITP